MKLNTKEEAAWYNEAIELTRLTKVHGTDLTDLYRRENKIRNGFINNYDEFPASLLREFIVEAVMKSERVRLDKVESRQRYARR